MGYQPVLSYDAHVNGFDDAQLSLREGQLEVVCLINTKVMKRLLFNDVVAFRYADEPYASICPDGAVDGVLIDDNSSWRKGLAKPGTAEFQLAQASNHFVTFISNCGLLEVIASSVQVAETNQ